jgi:hypothetical protein
MSSSPVCFDYITDDVRTHSGITRTYRVGPVLKNQFVGTTNDNDVHNNNQNFFHSNEERSKTRGV